MFSVAQGTQPLLRSFPRFQALSMTALPSFIELMASLGLESPKADTSEIPSNSPSIVVSEHDPVGDRHNLRPRSARYSPYSAPISHSHRRSSSSLSNDGNDSDTPNRATSASPRLSTRILGHRPSALNLGADSRHMHAVSESEMTANMPISTFVRRKTPQSSPVSPTFAHRARNGTRKRSQSPTMPVSIPTLPPVFQTSPLPEEQFSLLSVEREDDIPPLSEYPYPPEEDRTTNCVPPI